MALISRMKWIRRPARGFTLVEVMILLVVIALLLVMAYPALLKIRQAKQDRDRAAAEAAAKP